MAKLVYDETGRLLFTKEMKEEYTLLMPQMLPVHFAMMKRLLELEGYRVDMLTTNHRGIVDEGLKYVHNDTCYPALLVIGQLIDAVKHGGYDPHKVALLITQTGGGCRASNYIHLLRKALEKADMAYIPVISVNLSGMEKNPGFNVMTIPFIRKAVFAMMYGDLIVNVANQVRPYEVEAGAADAMIETWEKRLIDGFQQGKGMNFKQMTGNFDRIVADFAAIPVAGEEKVRVGVVGEIYIKYSPLGNNNLEQFLLSEGAEPVVPGLTDFIIFKIFNRVVDVDIYGGHWAKKKACLIFMGYIERCQKAMIAALKKSRFRAPGTFGEMHQLVQGYLGDGNKMGEGWLLTGEMLELIHSGVGSIVCTQPFGCLPNHIVGKGMIRKLKDDYPYSNIVAIDYDPGATKINQENRIKLMLANAKGLAKEQEEAHAQARETLPAGAV
ncbi:MAG: 2-hydroxyglutaryl-CoA dehydratase [Oscillospiraceae bacterium]|nr:2-hydroxyglutaryl-CoA dehydratase [Oscillospiraceae bacterium]